MLADCAQKLIWVSLSWDKAPDSQILKCTLRFGCQGQDKLTQINFWAQAANMENGTYSILWLKAPSSTIRVWRRRKTLRIFPVNDFCCWNNSFVKNHVKVTVPYHIGSEWPKVKKKILKKVLKKTNSTQKLNQLKKVNLLKKMQSLKKYSNKVFYSKKYSEKAINTAKSLKKTLKRVNSL